MAGAGGRQPKHQDSGAARARNGNGNASRNPYYHRHRNRHRSRLMALGSGAFGFTTVVWEVDPSGTEAATASWSFAFGLLDQGSWALALEGLVL